MTQNYLAEFHGFSKNKKKNRPHRNKNNYVALWLSPTERQLWNEKAVEKNLSISQFIRTCVDAVLFHHPEMAKDDSPLQEEITQLRSSMKSLENKYNLDRTAILSQMAQRNIEDVPLEEQIKKHLHGRSLFLNQIAAYCQANPREILSILAKMREKRIVEQDPQMRRKLIC